MNILCFQYAVDDPRKSQVVGMNKIVLLLFINPKHLVSISKYPEFGGGNPSLAPDDARGVHLFLFH